MKVRFIVEVEAPEGATHWDGKVDHPTWYKCTQIGVAGDHWWAFSPSRQDGWRFVGHSRPHWIRELSKEVELLRGLEQAVRRWANEEARCDADERDIRATLVALDEVRR